MAVRDETRAKEAMEHGHSHWLHTSGSFNLILSPRIRQQKKRSREAFSMSGISLKAVLRERENLNVPLTLGVLDREIRLLPDVPTHLYTGVMQSTVPKSTMNSAMMAIYVLLQYEHITYPGLVERVDDLLYCLVPWMTWTLDSFISSLQIFIPTLPVDGNICANIVTATGLCAFLIIVPHFFPQLFRNFPSSSHFRAISPLLPRITYTWILSAELHFHKPADILPLAMKGLLSGQYGQIYREQILSLSTHISHARATRLGGDMEIHSP